MYFTLKEHFNSEPHFQELLVTVLDSVFLRKNNKIYMSMNHVNVYIIHINAKRGG